MSKPTRTPIEIRPAVLEDAPAIAQVHVESWKSTYPGIVPQHYIDSLNVEEFTERWRNRLAMHPEMLISVAEHDGALRGFASGGPARAQGLGLSGELYALYLHEGSQRQGIGSRLFRRISERLRNAGHSDMYVWVLDENPAQRFYQRLGGRLIAADEVEIGGKRLKEVSYGWFDLATVTAASQRDAETAHSSTRRER